MKIFYFTLINDSNLLKKNKKFFILLNFLISEQKLLFKKDKNMNFDEEFNLLK